MMAKTDVNGPNASKAFEFLRKNTQLQGEEIPWNFAKFLIDVDGNQVAYYQPTTNPNAMIPDILDILDI